MVVVRVDVCVLGGGPSGLLAAHLLRSMGATTAVIASQPLGALRPIHVGRQRVTALPIFPVRDSALNRLLDNPSTLIAPSPIAVRFLASAGGAVLQAIEPGGVSPVLTHKLFGDLVPPDGRPLPEELQKKIDRHYGQHGRSVRIGFVHGVSPYLAFLEQIMPPLIIPEHVVHIDQDRKIVQSETRRVAYRHLLSTLPLPQLLSLLNIVHDCSFVAAPAEFHLLEMSAEVPGNTLVYDCDPESSLYRVYSATTTVVIAQAAASLRGGGISDMYERVRRLLATDAAVSSIICLRLPNCYPLSSGHERIQLIADLAASSTFTFGRFGTWEYKDIHELDWGLLSDLA